MSKNRSKNRIAALGSSVLSAALVGSVLMAPAAAAQEQQAPASPSAYAIGASGLIDSRISYVEGTNSTAALDVAVPEDNPLIHAQVAPSVSKPGYAHAEIVSVSIGQGSLSLTLEGITATCEAGQLSSSLATIKVGEESYPVSTAPNTELVPTSLSGLIDITLNQQVKRDNGPNTVTAVSVTILKAADELFGETPVLGGLAGQTITLASATCAKTDGGGDNGGENPSNGGGNNDGGDSGGEKNDGGDSGGDKNGGSKNGGDNGDGQVADEADEDGTAPAPVPQPAHISVTG